MIIGLIFLFHKVSYELMSERNVFSPDNVQLNLTFTFVTVAFNLSLFDDRFELALSGENAC